MQRQRNPFVVEVVEESRNLAAIKEFGRGPEPFRAALTGFFPTCVCLAAVARARIPTVDRGSWASDNPQSAFAPGIPGPESARVADEPMSRGQR